MSKSDRGEYAGVHSTGSAGHRAARPEGARYVVDAPPSDAHIREELLDLLDRDRGVDDTNIDVEVRGGEVVLDGHTCSHRSRLRAERLTLLVAGVTAVRNRVRVIAPSQ